MKLNDLIDQLINLKNEGHGEKEVWFRDPTGPALVERVRIDDEREVELS